MRDIVGVKFISRESLAPRAYPLRVNLWFNIYFAQMLVNEARQARSPNVGVASLIIFQTPNKKMPPFGGITHGIISIY